MTRSPSYQPLLAVGRSAGLLPARTTANEGMAYWRKGNRKKTVMPASTFLTAEDRRPWGGRILVLLAIAIAALNLRIAVTAVSPLLTSMAQDLGFSTGIIGLFGTLPLAAFAAVGLLTPPVIRTMGPDATTALSMGLLATGEITRAYAATTWALIALTAVALTGTALANISIPPLITRYFPDRSATLNTVQLVAIHIGGLLAPLVTIPVAQSYGWRTAIGICAAPAILATILWGRQWSSTGRNFRASVGAETSTPSVTPALRPWRTPRAWALAGLYGLVSSNVFILFTWLPMLLTTSGHSPDLGGKMVALVIAISLVASFTVPTLVHRLKNTFPVTLAGAVSFAAGYAGLAVMADSAPVLWSLLLGTGCMLFPASLTLITTHVSTGAGAAALSGFVQGMGCAIALFGPILFGLAYTTTGTWTLSYISIAGGSIMLIIILGWAVRHRYPIDQPGSTYTRKAHRPGHPHPTTRKRTRT